MYYKVITKSGNELLSAYIGEIFPNLAIKYKLNEWVKPIKGILYVFSNLEDAENFKFSRGNSIFECEVENPVKGGLIIAGSYQSDHIYRFLTSHIDIKEFCTHFPPNGTITCSAVKLLKEIE